MALADFEGDGQAEPGNQKPEILNCVDRHSGTLMTIETMACRLLHLSLAPPGLVLLLTMLVALTSGSAATAQPPPGYVDASTFAGGFDPVDATASLQAAINTGSNVWVPNTGSDWNITPISLNQSNQTILFEPGVVVAAKPGAYLGLTDFMFSSQLKDNVRLEGYGATFRMRQQDYLAAPYTLSQWRHAIFLESVTNFDIVGLTFENLGGDAIEISALAQAHPLYQISENILIQDVLIDNPFRNGISIIEVDGATIDNVIVASASGHAPQAGIDLEPNNDAQPILDVTIRDSILVGNFRQGIVLSTHDNAMRPASTGLIDNVTSVGNGTVGIDMGEGALLGWTIQDSLVGDNFGPGWSVGSDCHTVCSTPVPIEYSALWGNLGGDLDGMAALGPNSMTGVQPEFVAEFVSTDLRNPYFMYLEPSTTSAITQGASNGGHMGARPILWTGDMDGDGLVTNADVPWLIQAIIDPAAYALNSFTTPAGALIDGAINGDVNRDGVLDMGDVADWNTLLGGVAASATVPEPGSCVLFGLGLFGLGFLMRARSSGHLGREAVDRGSPISKCQF